MPRPPGLYFCFWRAENEVGFLFARVLVDVRIILQIGFRFYKTKLKLDWQGAWECKVSSAGFRWMVRLELMRICTFSIRESMCWSMCSTQAVVVIRLVKIKPWPFSIRTSQNNVGTPSPRNMAVGNVSVGNSADC